MGSIVLSSQSQATQNSFRLTGARSLLDIDLSDGKNLTFMEELLGGSGTCDYTNNRIEMKANGTGLVVYQTKEYFSPYSGSPMVCLMCANMNETNSLIATGTVRLGFFDSHDTKVNDSTGCGVFLESVGGILYLVKRTFTDVLDQVDVRIVQSSWNMDVLDGTISSTNPSGHTLNSNDILVFVIEVDGMKGTRTGFVIDNQVIYAHFFEDDVLPRKKLPIRMEVENTISVYTASLYSLSIQKEDLCNDRGVYRTISTDSATLSVDSIDKYFCSVRLGVGYERRTIRINTLGIVVLSDNIVFWKILLNAIPDTTTWIADGGIEVDQVATSVTGGTIVRSGFARRSDKIGIHTESNVISLPALTSSIIGEPDTYTFQFSTVGNVNVDISVSIEAIEIF